MLTLLEKVFLLHKMAPFEQLNLDTLLPIADKLILNSFEEEETIFLKGEEAYRIYFIVSGQVQLSCDQDHVVLREGEYFGDEALFNEGMRAYNAKSTLLTDLLSLSRNHLLNVCAECPSVALGFLTLYAQLLPARSMTLQRKEEVKR